MTPYILEVDTTEVYKHYLYCHSLTALLFVTFSLLFMANNYVFLALTLSSVFIYICIAFTFL